MKIFLIIDLLSSNRTWHEQTPSGCALHIILTISYHQSEASQYSQHILQFSQLKSGSECGQRILHNFMKTVSAVV